MKDKNAVKNLLTPAVEGLGYELWGFLLIPQGRHSVLRIYIDKEGGVNVDDCEKVSRQVSAVLDVEDPISGTYTLEVSSPGLDRPLFTLEQFKRFINSKAHIRLHMPVESRKNLKGVIKNVKENEIIVVVEEQEFAISPENIARANLVPVENLK